MIQTTEICYYKEHDNIAYLDFVDDFHLALKAIEQFSHCLLITKKHNVFYQTTSKILNINKNKLVIEPVHIEGEIIDIKPYFPCEDKIVNFPSSSLSLSSQKNEDFIGKYIVAKGQGVLKLDLSQIDQDELVKIQEAHVYTLYWWFNRFDKAEYRRSRVCNVPYSNAPKCGIFATRSPVRPNPIALTNVLVRKVDCINGYLYLDGFDGFEGSQVLQLSSYEDQVALEDVKMPKWVADWTTYKSFEKEDLFKFEDEVILLEEESSDLLLEDEGYVSHAAYIEVEGAAINNLKNLNVKIPKNAVTMITGVSGSGKSSLAFDTIYKESQRKYSDLMSSNHNLNDTLYDAKVKSIKGLQPAIAIEQRALGNNPRSTVGTATKVTDYLKRIYAIIGHRYCRMCHGHLNHAGICQNCGEVHFDMTPSLFSYNHPEAMCPVCKGLGEEIVIDVDKIICAPEKSILDGASKWWGNLRKHQKKPNANWMRGEVLALAY